MKALALLSLGWVLAAAAAAVPPASVSAVPSAEPAVADAGLDAPGDSASPLAELDAQPPPGPADAQPETAEDAPAPVDAVDDVLDAGLDAPDAEVVQDAAAEAQGVVTAPPPSAEPPVPPPTAAPAPPPPTVTTPAPVFAPWPLPLSSPPDTTDPWDIAKRVFPVFATDRQSSVVLYLLLLLLGAGASFVLGSARRGLARRGLLPRTLTALQVLVRLAIVVFAIGLFARWLPASVWPAMPWIVLAAAVAIGWSSRDVLPDLLAGLVIVIERRVHPGNWVWGKDFAGEVESLGVRAAKLRDEHGRIIAVPNRAIIAAPVMADTERWPVAEVLVRAPEGRSADEVRQALMDAALLSPWRALDQPPRVMRRASDPQLWHVRVRLLEARFSQRFETMLIDHVEQILGAPLAVCADENRK